MGESYAKGAARAQSKQQLCIPRGHCAYRLVASASHQFSETRRKPPRRDLLDCCAAVLLLLQRVLIRNPPTLTGAKLEMARPEYPKIPKSGRGRLLLSHALNVLCCAALPPRSPTRPLCLIHFHAKKRMRDKVASSKREGGEHAKWAGTKGALASHRSALASPDGIQSPALTLKSSASKAIVRACSQSDQNEQTKKQALLCSFRLSRSRWAWPGSEVEQGYTCGAKNASGGSEDVMRHARPGIRRHDANSVGREWVKATARGQKNDSTEQRLAVKQVGLSEDTGSTRHAMPHSLRRVCKLSCILHRSMPINEKPHDEKCCVQHRRWRHVTSRPRDALRMTENCMSAPGSCLRRWRSYGPCLP